MTSALDDLVNLSAPTNAGPDTTAPTNDNTDNGSTDSTDNAEQPNADPGKVYQNVLKTYTASELPAGENPPNTMTITEFAGYLTLRNVKTRDMGLEGIVQNQALYTAIKGVRNPLPVVLVFPDDADQTDQRTASVFLPVADAEKAWDSRPQRGEGGSASTSSKRPFADLLTDAAKKFNEYDAAKARLEKLTKRVEMLTNQYNKYLTWVNDRNEDKPTADDGSPVSPEEQIAHSESLIKAEADKLKAEQEAAEEAKPSDA